MSIRVNANAAIVRDGKILVIEFHDENGVHYNLPGGGVDPGESLENALKRECQEEACADVSVGRLLLVWEYVPELHKNRFGPTQKIGHVFECALQQSCSPSMPSHPDKNQTAVKWIPLSELQKVPTSKYPPLFPTIGPDLVRALENPALPIFVISRA